MLAHFGQEFFEQAEATSGDLGDAAYLAARGEADRLAHAALDGALTGHRLDAVVSLTGGPARLIDHVLGDISEFSTSGAGRGVRVPVDLRPGGSRGRPAGRDAAGRPGLERAAAARARVTRSSRPRAALSLRRGQR